LILNGIKSHGQVSFRNSAEIRFTIKDPVSTISGIEIYSLRGVKSETFTMSADTRFEIQDFEIGVYLVRVFLNNEGNRFFRLIKI
jgi:hypothetical protein